MMPGTPEQPTDEALGWSTVRTPEQLAAITAEIRVPVGVQLYVIAEPFPTLLRDGTIADPRTGVAVVLAPVEPGEPERGLCVVVPSYPTCRTLFGAIMDGLVQMEATDLAADVTLDGWPIFPEGDAANHSTPILDGSFVDPMEVALRDQAPPASSFPIGDGPVVMRLDGDQLTPANRGEASE